MRIITFLRSNITRGCLKFDVLSCKRFPSINRSLITRARCSMATLETLKFDNRALKRLPIDKEEKNYVRSVAGACFSRISPTPLKNPTLVAHSQAALDLLGLPPSEVARPDFAEFFCGNRILPGSEPAAHCYCGHQFGYFSGQLGDGCALYLGEIENGCGERWELQLKGSGKTPYSRHADGRKVLRSSIREFLCSEAMHYLGIPTTRAGTCITSDDYVTRDVFYTGNSIRERATVISRIAPTFLRFGSFEIMKTMDDMTGRVGPSVGRVDILHQLLDYTTQCYYPEIHGAHADDRLARTAEFFTEICLRTARLVAQWQCVGFCHGVLNTDNMSIIGLTIDYGPFGFMDRFDPGHICNRSDDNGRYAYDRQPSVCRWNLGKLAEALSPCLQKEKAQEGLQLYDSEFQKTFLDKMRLKLGLVQKQLPEDSDLIESFLDTLHKTGCDFTNGFQCLVQLKSLTLSESDLDEVAMLFVEQCSTPEELVKSFKPKMPEHQLHIFTTLMQQSPEILAQLGITPQSLTAELKKLENIERLKNTSADEKKKEDCGDWLTWLKTYRTRLLLEVEDLSEQEIKRVSTERTETLQQNNPRFVLRNHIAQKAIELAEKGDFSEVHRVLKLVESPYSPVAELNLPKTQSEEEGTEASARAVDNYDSSAFSRYFGKPPNWAVGLCVT